MSNIIELEPRLLRVSEAAKIAGVCKSRAYEFAANGTWHTVRLGRSVRIPRRGLERWLDELETQAGLDEDGSAA